MWYGRVHLLNDAARVFWAPMKKHPDWDTTYGCCSKQDMHSRWCLNIDGNHIFMVLMRPSMTWLMAMEASLSGRTSLFILRTYLLGVVGVNWTVRDAGTITLILNGWMFHDATFSFGWTQHLQMGHPRKPQTRHCSPLFLNCFWSRCAVVWKMWHKCSHQ